MRPLTTSLLKLLVEIVSYLLQFKLRKHLLTFQEQAVEQALACRQNAYLSCHSGSSELRCDANTQFNIYHDTFEGAGVRADANTGRQWLN